MPRHIAIIAPPVPGHYDPLKVLARALERRGHRVTFVHMADAAALVPGFSFEAVGARTHGPGALARYTQVLARASRPFGFFRMISETAAITRMLLEDLPAALERIGAEAVIADSTEAAGGLAARHLRLPWATSVTGLPLLREPAVPPPFIGWPYRHDAAGLKRNATGYRFADLFARPITRVVERAASAWALDPQENQGFSPHLQVAQCPEALDFPRRELPANFHYCGPWRDTPPTDPELPDDSRALVYCSLGSLQGGRAGLFAEMTEACARVGARAVVAHGGKLDDAAARQLPGDPIVRSHWHQPSVLPRCSAATLHAGFNTVLDALGAGVPMLMAPIAFEQPGTAARVVHAGAGRLLPRRRNADTIAGELRTLLETASHRQNAERMAYAMRRLGGVEEAAALIHRLFSQAPAAIGGAATRVSPGAGDARGDSRRSGSK
ncbi:glycosyltransferase [Sphingomonas sp.]|jgi:zeaxanthin glucosyltransferase|uniref:glycosyltransferase n=1 Tax=Sphingomonas sp. TaxID=28214 RepID=UPI002DE72021|nr:nucleotide disphospho-sugar-binding domain-containing protein [Sphingomonas sp.]